MDWIRSTRCERFEILKDIAALANVGGGGHIVIGRDEPALTSGSLTQEQADSFDPTKVNACVHRYLSPAIECRVETRPNIVPTAAHTRRPRRLVQSRLNALQPERPPAEKTKVCDRCVIAGPKTSLPDRSRFKKKTVKQSFFWCALWDS